MNPDFEIIDAHTHIYPPLLAKKARENTKMKSPDPEADGTLGSQLKLMKRWGISKSVALHMAGRPDTMHHVNGFAIETVCDELITVGSIHPFAEDVHRELDMLYEKGIRGVKFHNTLQNFNLEDPRCFDIYHHIGELGMVTVIHCGASGRGKDFWVFPENLEKVLHHFRGAPVVMAHMGGITMKDRGFEVLKNLPVYTDTALLANRMTAEEFAEAVQRLGAERVLFGSDLPWGALEKAVRLVEEAPLTREEKALIFSSNVKRLYRV